MKIPFFSKKIEEIKTVPIDYKPSMYFQQNVMNKINEQFKGEVEQQKVKFPTDLGEEHPFDFKNMEDLYKKFGFFAAVVDKYIDFIVGPGFYIECEDARAKEILEDFMKDVNFDTILRAWAKEALIKGNGFLEIGGSKKEGVKGLKTLNANWMYVVRDKKGKVEGYNQYKGAFDKFAKEKVINFGVDNIAHVPFNVIGDCAYGLGIGYTALLMIDNWLKGDKSLHQLMDRKANAPLHAKFGYIQGDTRIIPKAEDVQAFGRDLETMDNKTEWVTDPLVEFKVIDFGRIDQKLATVLENDLEMLIYAFQIPAVLLGKANIPEGLARVQLEAFQRRIQSIQAELEKIIEGQIFKRVLNANGLEVDVEFEWGTPSVMETEGRMKLISEMMKSPTITGAMNTMLEDEMINLLALDKDEWEKLKLEQEKKEEEERNRLENQPQPIVPGQNKGFPQPVQLKPEQPKQPKPEEMLKIFKEEISKRDEENINRMMKFQEFIDNDLKRNRELDLSIMKSFMESEKEKKDTISQDLQIAIQKIEEDRKVEEERQKRLEQEYKERMERDKKLNEEIIKKIEEEKKEKEKELERMKEERSVDEEKLKKLEAERIEKLKDGGLKNIIKQLSDDIKKMREESKEKDKKISLVEDELKKVKETPILEKRVKRIFKKKSGLLPPFKISRKTESVKTEEPKLIVKIKRKKEMKNYEYEKECAHHTESWENINDIEEWLGFNYKKYLKQIANVLSVYGFDQIKAVNEIELDAGYLSETQIEELRRVLDNGFTKGLGMREIAKQVDKKVGLKDLYRMTAEGEIKIGASGLPILARSAEKRAIGIVRTEVTNLANSGANQYYKENGIKQVRWVASFGDRTCAECEALNGQIFGVDEGPRPALHPLCKCTVTPVVELV